jgi:hypothetical protein
MLQVRSAMCRREDYPPYDEANNTDAAGRPTSDPDYDGEYPADCVCGHGYDEHSADSQLCAHFPYGCLCFKGYHPQEGQPSADAASPQDPAPRRTGASK